jgi:hypothetical protein
VHMDPNGRASSWCRNHRMENNLIEIFMGYRLREFKS